MAIINILLLGLMDINYFKISKTKAWFGFDGHYQCLVFGLMDINNLKISKKISMKFGLEYRS